MAAVCVILVAAGAVRTPPEPRPADPHYRMAKYRHLGATTQGEWAGVSARLTVTDTGVRDGTLDFVATRLLAKRQTGAHVTWLEAGWAETGWDGENRQRVYTYDSRKRTWRFHDRYRIAPGDRIWIELRSTGDSVWQAWLWWRHEWRLLTAERLPIGATGQMEQYVEVHTDDRIRVPPVDVDYTRLHTATGGRIPWRETTAPSVTGEGRDGYCVDWDNRYAFWAAGSC